MSAGEQGWVATIVARHSITTDAIEAATRALDGQGGRVERHTRSSDNRAVDLFFLASGQSNETPACAGVTAFAGNDLANRAVTPARAGVPFALSLPGHDIFIQCTAHRRKRVLVADMESTIIEQEMLDELAIEIGIGDRVAAITRRAMNGELDFAAALAERLRLLQGQPVSLLTRVAERMALSPGAAALVKGMQAAGALCWLVSGGFDFFVKIIAERLGFDGFFANRLIVRDGCIAGETAPPLLDGAAKRAHLIRICADNGCTPADALAIGDGANDVPMLLACAEAGGLGVAYRAKDTVRARIRDRIDATDLSALLYAQGLPAG